MFGIFLTGSLKLTKFGDSNSNARYYIIIEIGLDVFCTEDNHFIMSNVKKYIIKMEDVCY